MGERLERFRAGTNPLPNAYYVWELYGAGLEAFGQSHQATALRLSPPKPDEILLRVDAIGLCFSDTKLIWAGAEHPRIRGRDLRCEPAVPGHEASMTVVAVGESNRERFQVGERYTIQADIYIGGTQKAFGYVQRGALAQYVCAGPDILAGDDGCYLLPVQPSTGYAEAALVEPWTCVEAAYGIAQREEPKPGGRLLVIACGAGQTADLTGAYLKEPPAEAVRLGGPEVKGTGKVSWRDGGAATPEAVAALAGEMGFDDILLLGAPSAALAEACDRALAREGILCLIGTGPVASVDIGRVHYHDTRFVGGKKDTVGALYRRNLRQDLLPGGATWMIGAAGPMGQMHVQRALEHEAPPARILCTDVAPERMAYMETRLRPIALRRGIEMLCLNPMETPDFPARVAAFAGGCGFDDILVHAPVAKLVEEAAPYAAPGAVFNIFAGVPLGTRAALPLEAVAEKGVRFIGSSGSPLAAMQRTLAKTEAGALSTNYSLAAIGDLHEAWEGIRSVKEGLFPGKIVLFPQLGHLPLSKPRDLKEICPEAYALLGPGGLWTREAEAALFEAHLLE